MSGKRAKPSPWRFLRAAPVVVIAVVVWVLIGFFLLLPGSGGDQAHDWGVDPIPSSSDDEGTSERDSFSAISPEPSTPGTKAPSHPTGGAGGRRLLEQPPAPDLTLSRASTPRQTPTPAPRPTSEAPSPAPTQRRLRPRAGRQPGQEEGPRQAARPAARQALTMAA